MSSPTHGDEPSRNDDSLDALLGDLETASKLPAKRRQVSVKPTVERTASALYDKGAAPDELARFVDLLTSGPPRNHLDQASLGALIRSLYPAGKVDDETVLKVIGALGHGQLKPALPLQSLLLRWLVMVYHLLQNPGILGQAYGVLFNLLDTAALRPQLCHLLALVTRRKHVKPFRIQAILALSRQTGNDPPLVGLLRVFKNYYPEIIVGDATRGRAATFKHPDLEWRKRLDEIQQSQLERRDESGPRNGFSVNHVLSRPMKGAKASLLPAVHTQHAQENSVTLEEIDGVEAFVQNLEKIELPTQLVAVLADPLLQKLLLLRPDAEGFSRVSNWVTACMSDVASGDADINLLLDMIDVIHAYTINTRVFSPVLSTFFRFLFTIWNGSDKRDLVLETLSYAPLKDFKESYTSLFQPLENAILNNTPESQLSLLKFYTLLLRRWTIILLSEEDLDSAPVEAVTALNVHVKKLALTLTQTSPKISTYLSILDFYDANVAMVSEPKLLKHVEITIPHAFVVYILHFSYSLVVVSRLCGLLAAYKRGWEMLMTQVPPLRGLTLHERQQISTFNGCLMDICNCLWRGRAFITTDLNAQGCRIPRSLEPKLNGYLRKIDSSMPLASVFGLSYSPVFGLQAISCLREMEEEEILKGELHARHAGPVTQNSLIQLGHKGGLVLSWNAYRAGVLRHLEAKGLPGVPELLYKTMKNLMKEKQ
ncbi:centromere protein I [Rhypophila decipiens]|uniref:Centromere protein I n=1 Tax=Rhypophila decipiens TaxID=261697 RepID=A0AAN7B8W4_9PEZI|nr:centromere protein I [Rhypophila decipiens]